jgi:cell division protease FtsH
MNRMGILIFFIFMVASVCLSAASEQQTGAVHPIAYSQFTQQLKADNVSSVTIENLMLTGRFREGVRLQIDDRAGNPGQERIEPVTNFMTYLPFHSEELLARLEEKEVSVFVRPRVESSKGGNWSPFLPFLIIIGVLIFMSRRRRQVRGPDSSQVSIGESRAKLYDHKRPGTTFDDIAGMENVKQELKETIEFLKNPEKYKRFGAKIPKGVLLAGYPGTGKTLLARAVAGEAGVPFYSVSASAFVEIYVGVGASRVRDMFKTAKENQPSIIFIDEIDAVGRTREAKTYAGHGEQEQTLNQLLSEMDGFESHEEVIVMAATNRPEVLDPALLRPGRFDKHIMIDRPGLQERRAILGVHVRGKILADNVDLQAIARGTPGMTGADLENLANEAALIAIRNNRENITLPDFEEARDIVLMGSVRGEPISEMEKTITAYHESGHVLVARMLPHTDPIHKVTIIPRGMAMGVTQLLPKEDRHYYPKTYLNNKLCVALAGRVAERIVFNETSSGAYSDLKEATALAEKMVAQWGMGEEVGPEVLSRGEEGSFLGGIPMPKQYSEQMAWLLDKEIHQLVINAEVQAEEILTAHRDILEHLAKTLTKEEVLDSEAIELILKESQDRKNSWE